MIFEIILLVIWLLIINSGKSWDCSRGVSLCGRGWKKRKKRATGKRSWCLPPPTCRHLSDAAMWREARLTGETLGGDATPSGGRVDGERHRSRSRDNFGRVRMTITWKCSITCNTLAALPLRAYCACVRNSSQNNAAYCVWQGQTARSKWGGGQSPGYTYCMSCTPRTAVKGPIRCKVHFTNVF